jgi:hypothetical protein
MYNHILLNTINIETCENAQQVSDRIKELGLVCKTDTTQTRVIVKYPPEKRFSTVDHIRKSRGIIIDFPTKSVICHSLEGAVNVDHFLSLVPWNDIVIEQVYDGTMLNVYYDNTLGKWKASTKYSLTPETSHFRSAKSFVELFNEIVPFEDLALKLDKNYCYVFLMCHKEHRNVTPFERNTVYHLETTHINTGEKLLIDIGLPRCELLQFGSTFCKLNKSLSNISDLQEYVNSLEWSNPGVMLFSKDRKWRCKLENPNFTVVQKLLEGQSDFRYISMNYITKHITSDKWFEYTRYYPELNVIYTELSGEFDTFVKEVYQWYVDVHCFKKKVQVPKWVKSPMYYVHQTYITEKEKNKGYRMNITDVTNSLISKIDTALLYQLMKNRKMLISDTENTMSE